MAGVPPSFQISMLFSQVFLKTTITSLCANRYSKTLLICLIVYGTRRARALSRLLEPLFSALMNHVKAVAKLLAHIIRLLLPASNSMKRTSGYIPEDNAPCVPNCPSILPYHHRGPGRAGQTEVEPPQPESPVTVLDEAAPIPTAQGSTVYSNESPADASSTLPQSLPEPFQLHPPVSASMGFALLYPRALCTTGPICGDSPDYGCSARPPEMAHFARVRVLLLPNPWIDCFHSRARPDAPNLYKHAMMMLEKLHFVEDMCTKVCQQTRKGKRRIYTPIH